MAAHSELDVTDARRVLTADWEVDHTYPRSAYDTSGNVLAPIGTTEWGMRQAVHKHTLKAASVRYIMHKLLPFQRGAVIAKEQTATRSSVTIWRASTTQRRSSNTKLRRILRKLLLGVRVHHTDALLESLRAQLKHSPSAYISVLPNHPHRDAIARLSWQESV